MSHEEVAPFSMPFVNPNLIPSSWISSWTENPLPSNLPETDKNSFKFEPPPVSHANAQNGTPSDYPRGSLATKGQEESTREQRLERVQGGRGQQEKVPQGRRLERRPGGRRIELERGPEGRGGEGQATMDDDDDQFSLAIHTNCGSRIANTTMRTDSNGSNYSSNSSSRSNSNPNSGITFNPKPTLNANRTCSDPLYSAKPNPSLHPHSNSLNQNYNPNPNPNFNSHSNPNASHGMSGGGGSGKGSGKTVVVGVRLRHKMISQRYEISSDGRDLLQHTLTHLVEGGDTICAVAVAVAVRRPGAAEMSSQKYDESLQLEFTELLKTTIEHGRAKRVLVISKTPFAIRAMDGLISEVLNLNASTLVLGCNRKKLHRHWKEPGEYCVKKLPTDCRVLIVKNESFIFAESGVLKVESAPNILVGSNSNNNKISSHENGIERIVSASGFSPSPFPNVDSSRGKFMDMLEQEYSLEELLEATDNFSKNVVLGEGGCGTVYLGYLRGQQVAIKKLKGIVGDRNGWAQFLTEIKVVRKVFHKNLVQLKGSCLAGDSCFLVFDFLPNGSLDGKLRDPQQPPLTWAQRFKIAKGAAEGLKYLHEFCVPPIIHRDVKSANILLDEKFEPQVADFGLAKLVPDGQSQFEPFEVTAIMGTEGYVAPEYIRFGEVTEAIDVYSYGVVLLEILSGQKPASQARNPRYITDWAHQHSLKGDYEQIMDPRLNGEYDQVQAEMMAKIALVCTVSFREERPKMADVVRYLEDVETQSRRR